MLTKKLFLTLLPKLNILVLRQTGNVFIASKNSFIVDKAGLLYIIGGALRSGFITEKDILGVKNENT